MESPSGRRPGFILYLISDRKLAAAHGGLIPVCEAVLRAAADGGRAGEIAIQLREKDLPARELYELAIGLRKLTRRWRAALLINDRVDVAIAADADGVHLPARSFPVEDARKLVGPSRLIGVSTHSDGEVRAAAERGADFAVHGPVFPPLSKGGYAPPQGIAALYAACRAAARMPVYALGGITTERVGELFGGAGAASGGARPAGVAAIGAVFGAEEPPRAAGAILDVIARRLSANP